MYLCSHNEINNKIKILLEAEEEIYDDYINYGNETEQEDNLKELGDYIVVNDGKVNSTDYLNNNIFYRIVDEGFPGTNGQSKAVVQVIDDSIIALLGKILFIL